MFRLRTNHPDLGSSAVFAKRNALLERGPAFVALNFHPPLNLQQGGGETQLAEASCSLAAACDQLTGFWFGCLAGAPRAQKTGGFAASRENKLASLFHFRCSTHAPRPCDAAYNNRAFGTRVRPATSTFGIP